MMQMKYIQYERFFIPLNRWISLKKHSEEEDKIVLCYDEEKVIVIGNIKCPESVLNLFEIDFREFLKSDKIVFDLQDYIANQDETNEE